jgi:hypothetical protein
MSQKTELNNIKLKIKALAAKTVDAGCTEHEAMAAMAHAGRLLEQYNLTMEEIDVRQQVCRTLRIDTKGRRRRPIDSAIVALAHLVDAKVWFSGRRDISQYCFFGTEEDMELVEYLYRVIDTAIDNATADFKLDAYYRKVANKKRASTSFSRGMAIRISDRLDELRAHQQAELRRKEEELYKVAESGEDMPLREEAEKNNRMKGTALIVLKGQLIDEEFKKEGIKLGKTTMNYGARDHFAGHLGKQAGNKVNLSRPLNNGNKAGGYLA